MLFFFLCRRLSVCPALLLHGSCRVCLGVCDCGVFVRVRDVASAVASLFSISPNEFLFVVCALAALFEDYALARILRTRRLFAGTSSSALVRHHGLV